LQYRWASSGSRVDLMSQAVTLLLIAIWSKL
jgi:hypothetical protein